MEDLTDKVSDVSIRNKTEVRTKAYTGLRLVEVADYEGPTSVKYWM